MKIIEFKDFIREIESGRKGVRLSLISENLDDLWHLFNIISKGDQVQARTTRLVKAESEEARPTKGKRVPVTLRLRVEDVHFDGDSERLRIRGVVVEAPDRLSAKGSYHTINVKVNTRLSIIKEQWRKHHTERLERASHVEIQPIIVVALDDTEFCIALLQHYGFDVKLEYQRQLPGKREPERRTQALNERLKLITTSLLEIWRRYKTSVVIVGPGYMKDVLGNFLKQRSPELAKTVSKVATVSSPGIAGLNEALRAGILGQVASEIRANTETVYVEEALKDLGQQRSTVTYGIENTWTVAELGAIKRLLVSDLTIRKMEEEQNHSIDDLLRLVEKKGGEVVVVSSRHEGGKKLLGLGGVVAMLRFPLSLEQDTSD